MIDAKEKAPALQAPESGRTTALLQLVHNDGEGTQLATSPGYTFPTVSGETAIDRRIKVGESWTPIETGWIENPSLLFVHNEACKFRVVPTESERVEESKRVLEIASDGVTFATIHPKRWMLIEPCGALRLRCRYGTAKVRLVVIPGAESGV